MSEAEDFINLYKTKKAETQTESLPTSISVEDKGSSEALSFIKQLSQKENPLTTAVRTGGNILGFVGEQLSRPGYAVTTPLAKFAQGELNPIELAKSAYKGFALKEPVGFRKTLDIVTERQKELNKKYGVPISPLADTEIGKQAVSFLGDVALNPLNLPISNIPGATKLGSVISKTVAPIVSSTIKESPVAQAIGKVFIKNYALKSKFPEIAKQSSALEDQLKYINIKSVDEINRIAKLIPDKNERVLIGSMLENPNVAEASINNLSTAGKKIFGYLKRSQVQREAGILARDILPEDRLMDFYVRHAKTEKPNVLGAIKNAISSAKPKFLKQRKIAGTIDEINQKMGKPFFENDIALLQGIQQNEAKSAFAAHDYLKKLAENPEVVKPLESFVSKSGKTISKPMEGFSAVSHPLFEGKQVPLEIANDISRIQKLRNQDEGLNIALKAFDKVQDLWKGQVLIAPSYHARNMVGNFWNNYLAGVTNPENYALAAKLQIAERQSPAALNRISLLINGKKLRGKQLIDLAKSKGVLDTGWYGADIPQSLKEQSKAFTLNPIILNRKVGTMVENNAKLTHFIDRLKMGLSPDDAASSVKKYLFDYSDLSETEKQLFKRLVPFYTWSRKNIPLQLANIIQQPGKVSILEKAERNFSIQDKQAYEAMPSWLKERSAIPVTKSKDEYGAFIPEGFIPAYDVNKLQSPVNTLLESASPVPKYLIERSLNRSFYNKKPIENYPGETTPILGMDINKKDAALLSQIRVLSEANRLATQPNVGNLVRFLTGAKTYGYAPSQTSIEKLYDYKKDINELQKGLRTYALRSQIARSPKEREHALREIERIKSKIEERIKGANLE